MVFENLRPFLEPSSTFAILTSQKKYQKVIISANQLLIRQLITLTEM